MPANRRFLCGGVLYTTFLCYGGRCTLTLLIFQVWTWIFSLSEKTDGRLSQIGSVDLPPATYSIGWELNILSHMISYYIWIIFSLLCLYCEVQYDIICSWRAWYQPGRKEISNLIFNKAVYEEMLAAPLHLTPSPPLNTVLIMPDGTEEVMRGIFMLFEEVAWAFSKSLYSSLA